MFGEMCLEIDNMIKKTERLAEQWGEFTKLKMDEQSINEIGKKLDDLRLDVVALYKTSRNERDLLTSFQEKVEGRLLKIENALRTGKMEEQTKRCVLGSKCKNY